MHRKGIVRSCKGRREKTATARTVNEGEILTTNSLPFGSANIKGMGGRVDESEPPLVDDFNGGGIDSEGELVFFPKA